MVVTPMKNSKGKIFYYTGYSAAKKVIKNDGKKDDFDLISGHRENGLIGRLSVKGKDNEWTAYFREYGPGKMPEKIIARGTLTEVIGQTNNLYGLVNEVA